MARNRSHSFYHKVPLWIIMVFQIIVFNLDLANAGWRDEARVNTVSDGKQASRGSDSPWSIAVDRNNRVHVVWEDRRYGGSLRIFYRGKYPDPTWYAWDDNDHEISLVDTVNFFGHPSITAMANGELLSVYAEETNGYGELFGSVMLNNPDSLIVPHYVSEPGGHSLAFSSTGWQTTLANSGNRTIAFWPYSGDIGTQSLPVFYRIYENAAPVTGELELTPLQLGDQYSGLNLSAAGGSNGRVYLVASVSYIQNPISHIYLFTIDINTGAIIDAEDLTPLSEINCIFPYIAVKSSENGRDIIYVTYSIGSIIGNSQAVFIHNSNEYWSDPILLSSENETGGFPCLAINGDYVDFVYESPNNTPNSQIFHRRYDPSADTLSEPVQITHSDYFSKRPVIATDGFGNIHLISITNREHPAQFGDEEVYYCIYDAPPSMPTGVAYENKFNTLIWNRNTEPDIALYEIEIDNNVIYTTADTSISMGANNFGLIKVTAIDLQGQKSQPAIIAIPDIPEPNPQPNNLPAISTLGQCYPNPFNSSTLIPISVSHVASALLFDNLRYRRQGRIFQGSLFARELRCILEWPKCTGVWSLIGYLFLSDKTCWRNLDNQTNDIATLIGHLSQYLLS